jgi:hypothetical protein
MARTQNGGRQGSGRSGVPGGGLLIVLGSLLVVGCLSDERRDGLRNDPLRGGAAPIRPTGRSNDGSGAPATPASGTAGGNLTATPTASSTSTGSPAALASGSYSSPLDPNRSLGISSPQPSQPATGNEWRGQGNVAETKPERAEPGPTARASLGGFGSSSHITTYEQAQAILAARGVTWQRLETWGDAGEWKFSCRIPNPQNPYLSRAHEARAHEPIAALRAVIEQIENER